MLPHGAQAGRGQRADPARPRQPAGSGPRPRRLHRDTPGHPRRPTGQPAALDGPRRRQVPPRPAPRRRRRHREVRGPQGGRARIGTKPREIRSFRDVPLQSHDPRGGRVPRRGTRGPRQAQR